MTELIWEVHDNRAFVRMSREDFLLLQLHVARAIDELRQPNDTPLTKIIADLALSAHVPVEGADRLPEIVEEASRIERERGAA